MAYTKIKPIKSERHLQSAVNYVTREDKTDGKTNIYTHMCNTENAVLHFRNVREKAPGTNSLSWPPSPWRGGFFA